MASINISQMKESPWLLLINQYILLYHLVMICVDRKAGGNIESQVSVRLYVYCTL